MNPTLAELASSYVLDQLDKVARAAFEAHMAQDPELVAKVRELETRLADHVLALPRYEPPAKLLVRIEQRLDREAVDRAHPARNFTMIASTIARWGIAAVIALSLGIIALKQLYPSLGTAPRPAVIVVGLDPSQSRRAEFPVRERPHDSDAAFIQLAALAEKFWEQPQLLPLKPAVSTNANRAYAVFDPASRQGFIGIEQLPRLADGSRYHLWLVDSASGKIHDAGVLPLSQATHGLYFFSAGPNSGAKPARIDFFVTVEDADVSAGASPSGKVVLGQTRI